MEVGLTIGNNDETKRYKVYIRRDRVVITTPHVRNVGTLSEDGIRHLHEKLRRKDPTPKQLVAKLRKLARRRSSLTETTSNGCGNAGQKDPHCGSKGKKKCGSRRKGFGGRTFRVNITPENSEEAELKEHSAGRMTTRHMGEKHVLVSMISVMMDPKTTVK